MSYTLKHLAELVHGEIVGDPNYEISGVADLVSATPLQAAYLGKNPFGGNTNYEQQLKTTAAGVVVMTKQKEVPEGKQILFVEDGSTAFQTLIELFIPEIPSGFLGIHPTAVVHETAKLGQNVQLGPYVVVDQGVEIGDNTAIGAHSFIGAQTKIGNNCLLHPRVTIREGCIIGNRVVCQPGCVIGGCGYGFATDKMGKHTKLKQLGTVHVEDDVEIGANSTIDRGRFNATRIGKGSKIDNLAMIAHGVQMGEDNLVVAQVGIAGSTKTGKRNVFGGQAGIAGHIELCDDAIFAARSGVMSSIKEPGQYYLEPARPKAEARRHFMRLISLDKLFDRVKALEGKLSDKK